MKNKVLFAATVDYHFHAFHLPYLKWFKEQGWEVHVAAAGEMKLPFVDKKFNIPFQRTPFSVKNIKAYQEIKRMIEQENYQIIHCHTPMGGVLTRLAARKARGHETQVIYTAHGFHFCKGAPIQNWLLYYPIEKFLSRYTDCLITINIEDFDLSNAHRFHAASIKLVHGVGVDTERFHSIDEKEKLMLRNRYGYTKDQFLMFYAGEFNKNKNQQLLIKSLARIKEDVPEAKLLLAGDGPLLTGCNELANKLGVKSMVDFLGYRNDIEWLLKISDIAVASSLREGLPVNVMEAMACGLPIIAINNRGHRELVNNNYNGWVIEKDNGVEFSNRMKLLAMDRHLREMLGLNGRNLILLNYSLQKVLEEKREIYLFHMRRKEDISWVAH